MMNLVALPAFADNYIWMLHDGAGAAVVDPGDAAPVHAALDELGLELRAILVTHHHGDHVGGVNSLRARLRGPVFGPASESIPAPFEALRENNLIKVLGLHFKVLDVPGHTAGHIAYTQVQDAHSGGEAPLLFCGDTLFSAGCGRLFEGTPVQMVASLAKLAALPGNTRVCCTHEYTLANLRFAAAVEPENEVLAIHTKHCLSLRSTGQPTLPSSLALELQINPFLRCTEAAVAASAQVHGAHADDPLSVFTTLREWKNHYR
jgi:hydroxyacylglutathione hydrolase